jgi:GPH family glycoside/pentoside/hexuronide:cation symporter
MTENSNAEAWGVRVPVGPAVVASATPERLSLSEKLGYGCGDLSSNLTWGMTMSYLMYYYTDIYLIPAAAVAWLLLVPRLFDAFCDPLFGYIIDRTSGRHVKSMIGLLAVPFGVVAFLCFLPLPLPPGGKVVWAWVSYLAFGAMYSAINTPYGALGNMMTTAPQERVTLNAFRMAGCQIGQLAVAGLTLPAIAFFGGGGDVPHQQRGVAIFSLLLAVVGTGLWILTWRSAKIRKPLPITNHGLGELLSSLVRNRLWHLCNALMFLNFLVFCSESALTIHYTRFILHRPAATAGLLLTVATLGAVIGAVVAPMLTRRLGIRRTYGLMLVCELAGLAAMLAAGGNFTLFLVAFTLQYICVGVLSPLCYAMLAEAIDDGEAKTGVAATGLAYSVNSLVTKVAVGVTGFIIATLLAWGRYTPDLQVGGPDLTFWLKAGFLGVPCSAVVLAILTLCFWPADAPVRAKA